VTIQTRKLYGLLHERTGEWYLDAYGRVMLFHDEDTAKTFSATFLKGEYQVIPIIEKLERVE